MEKTATARRGPTERTISQISAAQNTFPGGKVAPKATDEGTGSSCGAEGPEILYFLRPFPIIIVQIPPKIRLSPEMLKNVL
jgi:hypothetical protein